LEIGVLGEDDPEDGASKIVRILYRGLYSGDELLPEPNVFLFSVVFLDWTGVIEPDRRIRFEDESESKAVEVEEVLESVISLIFSILPDPIELDEVFPELGEVEEVRSMGFEF